jgi:hypothetical protein
VPERVAWLYPTILNPKSQTLDPKPSILNLSLLRGGGGGAAAAASEAAECAAVVLFESDIVDALVGRLVSDPTVRRCRFTR